MMYHTRTRAAGQIISGSPSLPLSLYLSLRLSYARAQTAAECRATRFFFSSSHWNRKQKEEVGDVILGGSTEEYLVHKTLSV